MSDLQRRHLPRTASGSVIDALFAQLKAVGDGWTREAVQRRRFTAVDPVADTLEHCATELQDHLRTLEHDAGLLSVVDYARDQQVTPPTVRAWIRAGELPALVTPAGYRIRRDARRMRRAKSA